MRLIACVAVAIALLTVPASALGHATVKETSPAQGTTVKAPPDGVEFNFSEPVETSFGALRVFDSRGRRVDRGGVRRSDGGRRVLIALRDGLARGTYVATYRVVSADSHPISGGFSFSVGVPSAAPAAVDTLIDMGAAGPVTEIAFGVVRALGYVAIALAVGGLAFLLLVWRPALRSTGASTAEASAGLAGRARALLVAAVTLGLVTSLLAIAFQGATAAGTSLWGALDGATLRDVLDTRYGWVSGVRALVWLAVGVVLALPAVRLPAPARAGLLAPLLGFIVLSPALSGHASTQDASALLVPANFAHVAAVSVWVGGAAFLLLAVPAATRGLEPPDRTRLLARVVGRFSTVALVAVAVLLAGGIAQSIVELSAFGDLLHTPFGRAVLIKACVLACLIALGALARQRLRPRLHALASEGEGPGVPGGTLRRVLRAEAALFVVALGVTAALVSYSPPSALSAGPFAATASLGEARGELTVDPARVGRNELHLYLFDRRTGEQYERGKELKATMTLPAKGVGPISVPLRKAGPGHYLSEQLDLAPAGDWRLDVSLRVSEFDQYERRFEVLVE